jgi:DNA-binding transcriptional regulator YiaG
MNLSQHETGQLKHAPRSKNISAGAISDMRMNHRMTRKRLARRKAISKFEFRNWNFFASRLRFIALAAVAKLFFASTELPRKPSNLNWPF